MSDQPVNAEGIAANARQIRDATEREAFIQSQCAGDQALQAEVERLLAVFPAAFDDVYLDATMDSAHGIGAGSVELDATMDSTPGVGTEDDELSIHGTATYSPSKKTTAGLIAGKYRLLKQIGEGGMGSVWAAEQRKPVTRTVALKLIKKGMDSAAVLARFDAERQALALMDHPNIARIFDGGITEAGTPFFVMELVNGLPITEFSDAKRLTPRQRLELFVPVCQAIQHAHHKGIIHRDIKPSNVLVTMVDDRPVPKVIDFGVAKATGKALTELSLDTGFGIVGTPQYMSPEQASMNSIDIDTRSDVYSLGVLLYELLAGSPPFRKEELAEAGYMEILRVIREVDPPRPSTKLSSADALPSLSAARGTDPKRLSLLMRNELDWIVMRSLEKDRARRYETANAFAVDILRYLNGEAVQAHPPSLGYRLQKFLRKNRGSVVASGLVAGALIAGCIGTSLGMFEAQRQAELAKEEARLKEDARKEEFKQRTIAESEFKRAERERVVAEQRLTSARQTISAVVNNIPNLLERVPLAAGAQRIILSQMEELLSATDSDNAEDAQYESSRAWGLMAVETRAGQQALQNEQGELAEVHYRNALKIAKQVYDGEPRDRAKAAGNLAMAHALLAELLANSDPTRAEASIREAIRLREEALQFEQAEDSIGKRRANLGNMWNRLAGIQAKQLELLAEDRKQTDLPEALESCRTAMNHLRTAIDELADAPSEQATARRDQAAAAITLVQLATLQKDESQVINGYEMAKENFKVLAASEPERPYYRFSLADICAAYGDFFLVQKQDAVAARAQYVDSMRLLRGLNDDTSLEQLKQQRIMAYYRLGLAAEEQGNAEQVRRYFERAALLSDLHHREKSDAIRDPQLLVDDEVQLMLVQAWAGQERALAIARKLAKQLGEEGADRETSLATENLVRTAFAIAIYREKGLLDEEERNSLGAEALELLRQAIGLGYDNIEHLRTDPDVAPLRRIEGFKAVVQSMAKQTE